MNFRFTPGNDELVQFAAQRWYVVQYCKVEITYLKVVQEIAYDRNTLHKIRKIMNQ